MSVWRHFISLITKVRQRVPSVEGASPEAGAVAAVAEVVAAEPECGGDKASAITCPTLGTPLALFCGF